MVSLLEGVGFDVTVSMRIRYDIWCKLWGNLTMKPAMNAMLEAAAVGARIGCAVDQSP